MESIEYFSIMQEIYLFNNAVIYYIHTSAFLKGRHFSPSKYRPILFECLNSSLYFIKFFFCLVSLAQIYGTHFSSTSINMVILFQRLYCTQDQHPQHMPLFILSCASETHIEHSHVSKN